MNSVISRQIRPEVDGETLTLVIAGDTCPRETAAADVSAGRSGEILEPVRKFFDDADLRLVQWETPVTDSDTPIIKSGPNIRCAPDSVKLLQAGNFDIALLANNHIGDYGPAAVNETISRLHAAGLQTVGAGKDLAEARRPLRLKKNGVPLSIINVAEHEFGTATPDTPGANPLDVAPILLQIARERRAGSIVLVVGHGGNEYNPGPSPRMVANCRAFVEAGASAVVNIHTHCPQGMEIYQGAPIVYSTGNFFFPMREQQPATSYRQQLIRIASPKVNLKLDGPVANLKITALASDGKELGPVSFTGRNGSLDFVLNNALYPDGVLYYRIQR